MKYINLIIVLFLLFSCSSNDDDPNQTNILNLELGQKIRYVLLTGEGYSDSNSDNFIYRGDTLELEVLEVDNDRLLISEKITPFSNMMINNDSYYWENKDAIYKNYWNVRNDSLIFDLSSFRSHLIYRLGTFTKPKFLLREFEDQEIQILGWKTSFPYTESNVELFTKNYELLGNYYDRLNVFINNAPMATDGPGITTIYSKEHGIVRTSVYSWWTSTGYGWDLLEIIR